MGLTANTGPYNAAAEHYGVDDLVMSKIPRSRYQFMVRMTLGVENAIDSSYGNPFIFHRVRGLTLPDYDYNVMRLNQYNRMRYVHTRSEVRPFNIVFYDTKDNQFQNLLLSYARHYFSQGHNTESSIMLDNDPTTVNPATAFGTNAVPIAQRFFFDKIEILTTDTATSGRAITAYNCMITSVGHDNLDYSDSQLVTWNVQFQPEHVNISSVNIDNGSIADQGANSVTPAYNVTRSAAAGFLVDAAGELIRDAAGNTIPFSDVNAQQFANTATNFIMNGASNFRFDINGNPVTLGDISGFATNPSGFIANGAISAITNNASSSARNVIGNLSNTVRRILPF